MLQNLYLSASILLALIKVAEDVITKLVNDNFDLRPAGIIKELDLRRPIYAQTAAYGHFGRTDVDLPWEHTDKAETLRKTSWLIIFIYIKNSKQKTSDYILSEVLFYYL